MNQGFKEFALIGTEVGNYGVDTGTNLAELLNELMAAQGDYQVRLRNIHPKFLIEMLPQLVEIFKTGKIPYLESAVQSGNNRILKLMKRDYTIEGYKHALRTVRRNAPWMQIRTQIIAGFPGESEEEFMDSVNLIAAFDFDFVEVYGFAAYPNTAASRMNNKLPRNEILRRTHKLYMKATTVCKSSARRSQQN